jgi:hypothetical protein
MKIYNIDGCLLLDSKTDAIIIKFDSEHEAMVHANNVTNMHPGHRYHAIFPKYLKEKVIEAVIMIKSRIYNK